MQLINELKDLKTVLSDVYETLLFIQRQLNEQVHRPNDEKVWWYQLRKLVVQRKRVFEARLDALKKHEEYVSVKDAIKGLKDELISIGHLLDDGLVEEYEQRTHAINEKIEHAHGALGSLMSPAYSTKFEDLFATSIN